LFLIDINAATKRAPKFYNRREDEKSKANLKESRNSIEIETEAPGEVGTGCHSPLLSESNLHS